MFLSKMAPKDVSCWRLLAFLVFLRFCLCQDEYTEVSRRSSNPVAKVLQSHHQSGHKGSSSKELLTQRSRLVEWTVEDDGDDGNSPSTDPNALKPEVDDVAQATSNRVQVL